VLFLILVFCPPALAEEAGGEFRAFAEIQQVLIGQPDEIVRGFESEIRSYMVSFNRVLPRERRGKARERVAGTFTRHVIEPHRTGFVERFSEILRAYGMNAVAIDLSTVSNETELSKKLVGVLKGLAEKPTVIFLQGIDRISEEASRGGVPEWISYLIESGKLRCGGACEIDLLKTFVFTTSTITNEQGKAIAERNGLPARDLQGQRSRVYRWMMESHENMRSVLEMTVDPALVKSVAPVSTQLRPYRKADFLAIAESMIKQAFHVARTRYILYTGRTSFIRGVANIALEQSAGDPVRFAAVVHRICEQVSGMALRAIPKGNNELARARNIAFTFDPKKQRMGVYVTPAEVQPADAKYKREPKPFSFFVQYEVEQTVFLEVDSRDVKFAVPSTRIADVNVKYESVVAELSAVASVDNRIQFLNGMVRTLGLTVDRAEAVFQKNGTVPRSLAMEIYRAMDTFEYMLEDIERDLGNRRTATMVAKLADIHHRLIEIGQKEVVAYVQTGERNRPGKVFRCFEFAGRILRLVRRVYKSPELVAADVFLRVGMGIFKRFTNARMRANPVRTVATLLKGGTAQDIKLLTEMTLNSLQYSVEGAESPFAFRNMDGMEIHLDAEKLDSIIRLLISELQYRQVDATEAMLMQGKSMKQRWRISADLHASILMKRLIYAIPQARGYMSLAPETRMLVDAAVDVIESGKMGRTVENFEAELGKSVARRNTLESMVSETVWRLRVIERKGFFKLGK
jgi:hypothetical protein